MGESLESARIALRCDNPLIQLRAAANGVGIAELACFLGGTSADLVRVWPKEPPARRTAWLIIHQDMRRSARIKAVSGAISDAFRRQRKILEMGGHDESDSVKRRAGNVADIDNGKASWRTRTRLFACRHSNRHRRDYSSRPSADRSMSIAQDPSAGILCWSSDGGAGNDGCSSAFRQGSLPRSPL